MTPVACEPLAAGAAEFPVPAGTCSPRGTLGAAGRLNVSAWYLALVAEATEAAAAAAAADFF